MTRCHFPQGGTGMTGHSLWDFGEVEGLYAHLGMCRDGITSSHCASHGNAATRDMGTKDGGYRYQGQRMWILLSGSTFGPGLLCNFYFQCVISDEDLIIIFPSHNTALSWSAGE